jgi:hypothetical protein
MKFIYSFFPSVLLTFLLLLSGQAFATTYYSKTSGDWLATGTWSIVAPCGSSGGGGIPNGGDTLIICNGTMVTVGAESVGLNATVMTGGTLNLSTHVLTLSGALTNEGGTIDGDQPQAFVAQSIVHNGGTTDLRGVTTNSAHAITVTAAPLGLLLPTGLILIDNLFTSNVDFTMPGSVAHITGGIAVTGGTLTLNPTNNVTGNIVINDGAFISGTYPTPSGTITQLAPADPPIPPPPPCDSTTHHLTISSTGAYDCVANPVFSISAPIFSIKEKARVFIEEVL